MQILIVDDDADIVECYSLFLALTPHQVRVASSGNAAVELMDSCRPDVVLTDLLMPDGNGLRLIAEARARGIPFVVVSGHPETYDFALPAGTPVLCKGTFNGRELLETITAAINAARAVRVTA